MDAPGPQEIVESGAELCIKVIEQLSTLTEAAGYLVDGVAGHLGHPRNRWMARDAGESDRPGLQM